MPIQIFQEDHEKCLAYIRQKKEKSNKPDWGQTVFASFKGKTDNYAVGNYGEKMSEIILNRGGIPSQINKVKHNDIVSLWENKLVQVEVKTCCLTNQRGDLWFNQIRKNKGWEWIIFVVLDPSNQVRCYLCNNKTKLYSSGLLKDNNGEESSFNINEAKLLDKGFCYLYASGNLSQCQTTEKTPSNNITQFLK